MNQKFLVDFLSSQSRMETYGKAVTMLREIGFDSLARMAGEPTDIPSDSPMFQQMSLHENSERRGWYAALNFVFYFDDYLKEVNRSGTLPPIDFGADETLRDFVGATEQELLMTER